MNFVFYLHDEPLIDEFERKVLWLKNRYKLISYNDLYESIYNHKKINNSCHLTIDDGWLSTYKVVLPIMKKHGIPFTIFVSPEITLSEQNFWYREIKGVNEIVIREMLIDRKLYKKGIERFPIELLFKEIKIDDVYSIINEYWSYHGCRGAINRGFINLSELKELNESGIVEVGAHTLKHPILSNEETNRSEYEISESVFKLSKLLNKKITAFAYPNGLSEIDFGVREMQIASNCGIKMAFSVNPGILNSKVNPLSIPRIGSFRRLKLGHLGVYLPSLAHQKKTRSEIRKYLIQ